MTTTRRRRRRYWRLEHAAKAAAKNASMIVKKRNLSANLSPRCQTFYIKVWWFSKYVYPLYRFDFRDIILQWKLKILVHYKRFILILCNKKGDYLHSFRSNVVQIRNIFTTYFPNLELPMEINNKSINLKKEKNKTKIFSLQPRAVSAK